MLRGASWNKESVSPSPAHQESVSTSSCTLHFGPLFFCRSFASHTTPRKHTLATQFFKTNTLADSTAYRELLPGWEAKGVKVVQVFSESKQGYVHDVFEREGLSRLPADAASAVGALLCGHKGMCQAVTSLLTTKGVPPEKILLNF